MRKLSLLCLLSLFILASCKNKSADKTTPTGETVTITHPLDTVQVPVNPQRIVVLSFGALENLSLIDANVVGVPKTGLPDYLSRYKNDSIVNLGNLVQVSMEKINGLRPDLIIMGPRLADSYEEMSAIAPTIMPTSFIEEGPVKALHENLRKLGKIFGEEAQDTYEQALIEIGDKVKNIRKKAAKADMDALAVLHNRGRFSAYGSGSRFGVIHDTLGIKEAKKGLEGTIHGVRVSSEFIKEVNPDILFIVDRNAAIGEQPMDKANVENALIQQTKAYKNDRIIYLNPQAWYLSGGSGITSLNIMLDEVAQALE